MDNVPVDKVTEFEKGLLEYVNNRGGEVVKNISETGLLEDNDAGELNRLINDYKDTLDYLTKEEGDGAA